MIKRTTALIALAFVAFISLGLPDGLLGVAWPGIREHFGLPLDALGLFLVFMTAGYMTSSFFSGVLVRALGLGGLLAASSAATALALLAYSLAPSWWFFVLFALMGGGGAGAIDAGLNNYIDRNHSERLMQWLHASFGVGITMGPIIMTTGISLTGRWQIGYQVVAAAQMLLALAFLLTRHLWRAPGAGPEAPAGGDPAAVSVAAPVNNPDANTGASPGGLPGEASIWQSVLHLRSLAGMLLFFVYTGAELGVGVWAYTFLTESRGVDPTTAGLVTGSYWASFTAGRILAGLLSHRLRAERLVSGAILLAAAGIVLVWLNISTAVTVAGIALAGFALAPVFPGLMSDTRNRVDERHLSNTIGMQIAGAGLGAAVLPAFAGVSARVFGLEAIPPYILASLLTLFVLFVMSHLHGRRSG